MVQLLLELTCVDQPGKLDGSRAIENAEGDLHMAVTAEDRLRHQQFVEIGVEHRAHDGVDLPVMIVDAGGNVGHGRCDQKEAIVRATLPSAGSPLPMLSACASYEQQSGPRRGGMPAARGGMAQPRPQGLIQPWTRAAS